MIISVGAQFFITFAEAPSINSRAVLFGEINDTESMKTCACAWLLSAISILLIPCSYALVARIEDVNVQLGNKDTSVIISDCGIVKNHPGFLMTRFYESDPRSPCLVGHPPVRIIPG